MAIFEVTDPQSGRTIELEGDSAPTEAELIEIFDNLPPIQAADATPEVEAGESTTRGRLEALATILTSLIAEPAAGAAGVAATLIPGGEPGVGEAVVEGVREALTFQPRTEAGQESLEAVGEFVEPVGKVFTDAEKALGDATFDLTGSPALAAAASTIPTAGAEVFGVAAAKGVTKIKRINKADDIAKQIADAAPTIEQLKEVSRGVFQEIDDLGVTMTPRAFQGLTNKLVKEAREAGLDPDITPKANKALGRFQEIVGSSPSLTEIDILRKVANNAAKSIEKADAALGVQMINTIDEFLDQARPSVFRGPKGAPARIGKRYKVARDLWGRARRAELIGEAFTKARLQASGFENGIRVQFRQLLNNKKTRRLFKPDEIAAMTRVVKGGKKENLLKLIGKFGFSEGLATNALTGSVGVAGGAAAFGPIGAVAVPVIGQVAKAFAARLTAKGAEFADQVIRAGTNAKKITAAYNRNTPVALRDPAELSQLLMRPDIDLSDLPTDAFTRRATDLALEQRGALAGGELTPGEEE